MIDVSKYVALGAAAINEVKGSALLFAEDVLTEATGDLTVAYAVLKNSGHDDLAEGAAKGLTYIYKALEKVQSL